MRTSQKIMGTGASIDIPGLSDPAVIQKVFKRLSEIDERFSPYKPESELSRFQRGDLHEQELSREFRHIMKACLDIQDLTNGFFSAWFEGSFDPTGYVKGWSIAEAAKVVEKAGHHTFCIGIGGDIYGKSDSDKIWSIGLQDPTNRGAILGSISASTLAVATSGLYERGAHIIDPRDRRPATSLLSVTVAGPDIILADVFATAVFVMGGPLGLYFIEDQPGYEALIVGSDRQVLTSSGMIDLLKQKT